MQLVIKSNEVPSVLDKITKEYKLLGAQLFDSRLIWGYRHIHSTLWHAEKAFRTNSMISKSLTMEIMIYAAGYRQIKKAIELLGIQNNSSQFIGILVADDESQLKNAFERIKQILSFNSDLSVIENYSEKKEIALQYLEREGYGDVSHLTFDEIEKIFLQKSALLSLDS